MEINENFKGKKILAWDPSIGDFAWVSPRVLTTTIYNEKGEKLDDILKVTPADLEKKVEKLLKDAPEAYEKFLAVSKGLDENKNSIQEIFREIARKVSRPEGGTTGQVLMLDESGNIIFADIGIQGLSDDDREKLDSIEYGANKTLIVNDLSTGGAGKALSAEQGKALKESLDTKIDKEEGKGLSTNDFDNTYKGKVDASIKTITATSNTDYVTLEYINNNSVKMNTKITSATQEKAGVMSISDKTKLNDLKLQVILTDPEYNALSTAQQNDETKIYFIKEG